MRALLSLFLGLTCFFTSSLTAQVTLPRLISDGMVLQRNADIKIWGWAGSGDSIDVSFIDKHYQTIADEDGKWEVPFEKLEAGGPYSMIIQGENRLEVNDILVGDVWICSGQSNMELNMMRVSPLYEKEIAESENRYIRYFEVPDRFNFAAPQEDLERGMWLSTTPESVLKYAAVCYFFGLELHNRFNVPIGLINAALGGSPAESWLSEEALKEFPDFYNEAQKFKDPDLIKKIREDDNRRIGSWYIRLREKDEGYRNPEQPWYNPDLDISGWKEMEIPGYWADYESGSVNGVVWFRREVEIPESAAGKPARLNLGRIIDADSVFVNGRFVGTTSYQYPPRRYTIPEGVLKTGKNTIVVRVISNIWRGGFEVDKPYELILEEETIDLKGAWRYRVGATMEPLMGQTFIRWKPGGLYNAMIAPLLNYGMRGVIWYQGEANAYDPVTYRRLFPALISDWRNQFNQGDFPFLYVQLPNFMESRPDPSESNWAMLREAQLKTLSVPNTGMAVAIDIGEWNDIHPLNKQDVGKRLALHAMLLSYVDPVINSGPLYKSMEVRGKKVIIHFSETGSGLEAKGDGNLMEFAVSGKKRRFHWAKAKIKGNTVIVKCKAVPEPVAVRYAWADNPEHANLYNKEGLPASPFRTDDW